MIIKASFHSILTALTFLGAITSANATDVSVTGLFSGKAMISVNAGPPRLLSVGQMTPDGIKLLNADSNSATFEINGKRQTLSLGQGISSNVAPSGKAITTLTADIQGHFLTTGSINGASTVFLVDTGASDIAISASEAKRMGISYLNGKRGYSATANGTIAIYQVTFNTVKVGGITLNQVEGSVIEGNGLPVSLLGMSFLKRLEMKREGTTMTLTKQY